MAGQGLTPKNRFGLRNGGVVAERATFTDLNNPMEPVEVQFNPTEFTKSLEVEYSRQTVPGLSHKVLQYISTSNVQFELELYMIADTRERQVKNLKIRKRLESFCYPRGASSIGDGGPPRILFVWPGFISLSTVFTSVSENYTRFAQVFGSPSEMTLTVTLEEIRDVRLLQEDVELSGLERSTLEGESNTDFAITQEGDTSGDGWE